MRWDFEDRRDKWQINPWSTNSVLEGSPSCFTSAVMGELAMPNVLFTQIAWLCLFESCYLLPLISKVAANARTGGTAAAPPPASSTPENNGVLSIQESNLHMTLERKRKYTAQCGPPETVQITHLSTTELHWRRKWVWEEDLGPQTHHL